MGSRRSRGSLGGWGVCAVLLQSPPQSLTFPFLSFLLLLFPVSSLCLHNTPKPSLVFQMHCECWRARCSWWGRTWSLGGWRQTCCCYLSEEGPQHLAMRVPTHSLLAARESIFTPVLCVSLGGRGKGIGTENYTTLDSGNLLNTKGAGASADIRGEHFYWTIVVCIMQHNVPETFHYCQGRVKAIIVELNK